VAITRALPALRADEARMVVDKRIATRQRGAENSVSRPAMHLVVAHLTALRSSKKIFPIKAVTWESRATLQGKHDFCSG